jgi:DNA-binding GntR family transcriptional regulator
MWPGRRPFGATRPPMRNAGLRWLHTAVGELTQDIDARSERCHAADEAGLNGPSWLGLWDGRGPGPSWEGGLIDDAQQGEQTRLDGADKGLREDERLDSLVVSIRDDIAGQIITGELLPGADLNSVDLARRFSSSRTPVREALLLLAKEGLVDIEAGKRPRVAEMSLRDIQELYAVRVRLLTLAAQLLVARLDETDAAIFDAAAARVAASAQAKDLHALTLAITEGLDAIVQKCGNALLVQIMESLRYRTYRMLHYASARISFHEDLVNDNLRLMKAIKERDAPMATALIESLTSRILRWLEQHRPDDQLAAAEGKARKRPRAPGRDD